jgi:hypothetical protein
VGTLLILLLGWYFVHSRSAGSSDVVKETPAQAPVAQKNAPTGLGSNATPSAAAVAANVPAHQQQTAAGDSRGQWRVIAFTYNREDQAQQKAAAIAQSHPDLSPTVFTPNGHAPFLVTLGGAMSRQDAFALSGKAKREGMPRDIYAQNYRGSGK